MEIPSLKLVKNLFEVALGRIAVLFHKIVSYSESKTGDARLPINFSDVERKVSSRVERKSRENFGITLLLVNILSVDEVT